MNTPTKRPFWSWRRIQASLVLVMFGVSQWQAAFELAWAELTEVPTHTPLVAILVEKNLLNDGPLKSKIYRYAEDVQNSLAAQALVVPLAADTSTKDIYEGLSSWYWSGYQYDPNTKLQGVVLVGDLPIPTVDKNGRNWPSIFPYVDFEAPAYVWDDLKLQFVSHDTKKAEAEIWHGLIRGASDSENIRREQLRQYFDRNHKVHTGETVYDQKVLHANLNTQKSAAPSALLDRYGAWIEHAEDLQYSRYTKHLLRLIQSGDTLSGSEFDLFSQMPAAEQSKLIAAVAGTDPNLTVGDVQSSIDTDVGDGTLDIYTKYLVDQLALRYQDIYKHWISRTNGEISNAGRWDPLAIDTLPTIVSARDEASVLYLRTLNDRLENRLIELVETANVANRPWVEENTEVQYYEDDGLGGQTFFTVTRPNYWNGVARDANFTVENCTLNRGQARTSLDPTAQQVEANRTFVPDTADSCVTDAASDADKQNDQYEGCCAANLSYGSTGFSYTRCNTGSAWIGDEGIGSVEHLGAELPVYDLGGTKEQTTPVYGAAGCLSIIETVVDEADSHRFSTLMRHQEPTPETLQAQTKAQSTQSLPVDARRGFSFLDHGRSPQRVDFINTFDLRTVELKDSAETTTTFTALLNNKIGVINRLITAANTISNTNYNDFKNGCGGAYAESNPDTFTIRADCGGQVQFFETGSLLDADDLIGILDSVDIDQFYQSITWLDKTVDQKNAEALALSLSDRAARNEVLLGSDFVGYEFAQIVGSGDSDALDLSFSPRSTTTDEEFLAAQREALFDSIETEVPSLEFAGVDFEKTFAAAEALSVCDDIPNSVLDWGKKLQCHLENTPAGGTIDVFIPNLGEKVQKRSPIVVDTSKPLADKIVRVSPAKVLVHNQATAPVPVTVFVTDKENRIQKDLATDQVSLRFSSPSVSEFFEVFPEKTLPLVNGRAEFWLIPKTKEVGGKFALIAEVEQGDTIIRSTKVPLWVPRNRLTLIASQPAVTVKDGTGVPISFQARDGNDDLTDVLLDQNFELKVSGGVIEGGNVVTLDDLTKTLNFLPGPQAGTATIEVIDPTGTVAGDTVSIELLPAAPAAISLSSNQGVALENGPAITVEASVTDAYGNAINNLLHEYSWNATSGKILQEATRDESPREVGLQELVTTGQSVIKLSPATGKMRLEVTTDKLPRAGRSLEWDIIKNPKITTKVLTPEIVAGTSEMTIELTAVGDKNGRLVDNFSGQIVLSHLGINLPVTLKNGLASTTLPAGTVAGDFKGQVHIPGFKTAEFSYTVLPAEPHRLMFATDAKAQSYAIDQAVDLTLKVTDRYGNLAQAASSVLVKASDLTNDLIEPVPLVPVEVGATELNLVPTGKTGTLNLIAHLEGLVPATLSVELVDHLEVSELTSLSPNALLAVWLGFESGNMANAHLHAGNSQAVGGLIAEPTPGKMIGQILSTGKATNELEFLHLESPVFQFKDGRETLAQGRLNFGTTAKLFLEKNKTEAGIYIDPVPRFENDLTIEGDTLMLVGEPLLKINNSGGILPLDATLTLRPTGLISNWLVYQGANKLGALDFYIPNRTTIAVDDWGNTTPGLQLLRPTNDNLIWEKNNHWDLIDTSQQESLRRSLGSSKTSVEDSNNLSLGWTADWKPGTLLAAGNSIGDATRIGASDIFVLYGDPTLSLKLESFGTDIGRAVWTAPTGSIDHLLSGYFITKDNPALLTQSGKQVRLIKPSDNQNEQWHDAGEILTLQAPAVQLVVLKNGLSQGIASSPLDQLVALESDGRVRIYTLKNGNWENQLTSLSGISWIGSGVFNEDDRSDIAFLDQDLNLGVSLHTGTSFSTPVYLDSLAPNFSNITEKSTDDATSYLEEVFVGYKDIGKEIKIADKLQSINVSRAERTPLVVENLAEDLESAYRDNSSGFGNTKYFVPLLEDPSFGSQLTLSGPENTLKTQDKLKARLTLRSDNTRQGFEIMLPGNGQLSLDRSSLRCEGCATKPRLFAQNGFGAAWAYLDTLPARQSVTLTWDYEVEKLSLNTHVTVSDRDGDGRADITVPRGEQLTEYLSRQQPYDTASLTIPSLDQPIPTDIKYVGVPTATTVDPTVGTNSYEALSEKLTPLLTDPDIITDSFIEKITSDDDEDGIPNNFDDYPAISNDLSLGLDAQGIATGVSELMSSFAGKKSDMLCGYGDCFNFPDTTVMMAPGISSEYEAPMATPSGQEKGQPILSWPTTLVTPTGPIPVVSPVSKIGEFSEPAPFTSLNRLYLMPSSNGHLGIGLCTGLYTVHTISPVWITNCQVVTPRIDFLGVCESETPLQDEDVFLASANNSAHSGGGGAVQVSANSGASSSSSHAKNENKPGTEKISDYVLNQTRAIYEFVQGLPTTQTNLRDTSAEGHPAGEFANHSAFSQLAADVSHHQFINSRIESIQILVPNTTMPALDSLATENQSEQSGLASSPWANLSVPNVNNTMDEFKAVKSALAELPLDQDFETTRAVQVKLGSFRQDISPAIEKLIADHAQVCSSDNECGVSAEEVAKWKALNTAVEDWETALSTVDMPGLQAEVGDFESGVDDLLGSLESIKNTKIDLIKREDVLKKNQETLRQYQTNMEVLSDVPQKVKAMQAKAVHAFNITRKFHQTQLTQIDQRLAEWDRAYDMIRKTLGVYDESVLQVMVNFSNNCQTCAIDQGTLLPWLLNTLMGPVDLPIFELPKMSDIAFAITGQKSGVEVVFPKIEYLSVEFSAPEAQDMADFSNPEIDESLEKVASLQAPDISQFNSDLANYRTQVNLAKTITQNFPAKNSVPRLSADGKTFTRGTNAAIPIATSPNITPWSADYFAPSPILTTPTVEVKKAAELTQFGAPEVTVPNFAISLPEVATLPPPPELPLSFVDSIVSLVEVPFSFLDLFCILRLGVSPVPEWYLKEYTEGLLQRAVLKDEDFDDPSLKDANLGAEAIEIVSKSSFSAVLDPVSNLLKAVSRSSETLVDELSANPQRGEQGGVVPLELEASLPSAFGELQLWAQRTRAVHAQNQGKMVELDEFWEYFTTRMRLAQPKTLTQHLIQQQFLLTQKPVGESLQLASIADQKFENTARALAKNQSQLEKDLALLEDLQNQPWSTWADNLDLQARQRFLATVESEYEFYESDRFSTSGSQAAEIQADGSTTIATPNLLDLPTNTNPISAASSNLTASDFAPRAGLYYQSEASGSVARLTDYVPSDTVELLVTDLNKDGNNEIWWTENGVLYLKDERQKYSGLVQDYTVKNVDTSAFLNLFGPGASIKNKTLTTNQVTRFIDNNKDLNYWEMILSDHYDIAADVLKRPESRLARSWERFAYLATEPLTTTGVKIEYIEGAPQFTTAEGKALSTEVGDRLYTEFSVSLKAGEQVELLLPDGSGVSLLAGEQYRLQAISSGEKETQFRHPISSSGFGLLVGIRDNKRSHLLGPFYHPLTTP